MKAVVAITSITLSVYLVAMFGSSKSLKCYVCNLEGASRRDPDCEIIDSAQSTYSNKCEELGVKCGTIVTYGRQNEVESVSRGCMEAAEAERCENLQHPFITCQTCETDECNDSSAFDIIQNKATTHDPSEL